MASTRNKNTQGDYNLEQSYHLHTHNYNTYECYGTPLQPQFAGDGLLGGKIYSKNLSSNYCDIESDLRGIGSTNLVNPQTPVTPDLYKLKSLSIIDKTPVILPNDLYVEPYQRPFRGSV